jgi:hypothetical protein
MVPNDAKPALVTTSRAAARSSTLNVRWWRPPLGKRSRNLPTDDESRSTGSNSSIRPPFEYSSCTAKCPPHGLIPPTMRVPPSRSGTTTGPIGWTARRGRRGRAPRRWTARWSRRNCRQGYWRSPVDEVFRHEASAQFGRQGSPRGGRELVSAWRVGNDGQGSASYPPWRSDRGEPAVEKRRSAMVHQIASTMPNGQAPIRNP